MQNSEEKQWGVYDLMTSNSKRHASKDAVQRFNDSVELLNKLTSKALDVLRILGTEGCTASDAQVWIPCSKGLVSYWKDFFVKIGALKLNDKSDVVKYYDLTPFGSKLLAMSESGFVGGEVYCLEDYAFRFDLLRDAFADSPFDWRRGGMPKNWCRFKGFSSEGVRVVKNEGLIPSVEIHPGKLRDFDPYVLVARAGEIVERVRGELAARHGIVLSDEGVPLHGPMFQVFSAKADLLLRRSGLASLRVDLGDGEEAHLDKSPPDRVPHKEFSNVEYAVADLQAPKLLVKLQEKVKELEMQVGYLSETNTRVVEALNVEVVANRELRETLGRLLAKFDVLPGDVAPPSKSLEVPSYVA